MFPQRMLDEMERDSSCAMGGKRGENKITGRVCGIQPFLFKQDGHMMVMEDIECSHKITGVPGKPGDGFAHDAVDLLFPAMPQEPFVACPVLLIRAGNPIIRIDACTDPFRVPGQKLRKISILGFVGIFLVGRIRGNPDIGSHTERPVFVTVRFISAMEM